MTSAARQAEADRVELVYYWALNQLGNAMAIDALELWQQVPASEQAATSASWLARILRLVLGFRSEAHALAVAYYRLVRALRTGFTPATGGEKAGDKTSLEGLRQEFEKIVDHIDAETAGDPRVDLPGNEDLGGDADRPDDVVFDEDAEVEIEDLGNIDELIDKHNEINLDIAATDLDRKGIENFLTKLKSLNQDDDDLEALVSEAHDQAGARQAAAAMRITMNAARELVYDLASTDLRIIGWARYSRTGTPCGWCAMLISRGFTAKSGLYSTRQQAQHRGKDQEEDKYHDNCRCIVIPIFLKEQLDTNLFALNREYAELWPEVTKGLTGKDALAEWRRYFRQRNREAAQAAA